MCEKTKKHKTKERRSSDAPYQAQDGRPRCRPQRAHRDMLQDAALDGAQARVRRIQPSLRLRQRRRRRRRVRLLAPRQRGEELHLKTRENTFE